MTWRAEIWVPGRITPHTNRRQHWATAMRAKRRERAAMRAAWFAAGRPVPPSLDGLRVRFVRCSPRRVDSDNLESCFKYFRDELAALLCMSDDSGEEWQRSEQERSPDCGVRVEIWTHEQKRKG